MLGGFAAEAPPPSEECQLFNMEAEVDKLELMVSAREGVLRGNPFFFFFSSTRDLEDGTRGGVAGNSG